MILILSDNMDFSTASVAQWLLLYNEKFVRINETDKLNLEYITIDECVFEYNKQKINLQDVKSFWFRRGYFDFLNKTNKPFYFNEYLENEYVCFTKFLYYKNKYVKQLNNRNNCHPNKLIVLEQAKALGLLIPPTIVTGSKKKTIDFYNTNKSVITKPLDTGNVTIRNDLIVTIFTEQVSEEFLANCPETFYPTLFQKNIKKKYELRIFFLADKCYSMAIFSQSNAKTAIDFRKYDDVKPNRNVPFNLPKEIEQKLIKLMKILDFESGSIDILVDENDDYYFLEVNPVGQFGMTSYPCNYFLEREIANYLKS